VIDQKPIYGRMFQVQFAEAIRNVPGMATMAVGAITEPGQVNTIVLTRRADLVALGRPHMWNPYFAKQAAAWYGAKNQHWPKQYLAGRNQAYRETERTREKQVALQIKARPNRHGRLSEAAATPLAAE
jgi:anthraniloyl-CoA monooxygenase